MGTLIVLAGLVGLLFGLINVIYPLGKWRVTSRKRGAAVFGSSLALVMAGAVMTPQVEETTDAAPTTTTIESTTTTTMLEDHHFGITVDYHYINRSATRRAAGRFTFRSTVRRTVRRPRCTTAGERRADDGHRSHRW